MTERFECPEEGCWQTLQPSELFAHLKMDHNRGVTYAEQVLEDVISGEIQ